MAATNTSQYHTQSPVSSEDANEQPIREALTNLGFKHLTQISETLQGSVWRGEYTSNTGELIPSAIKITNKDLHQNAKGFVDGTVYSVDENILMEQAILKFLTQQKDCPQTIVKYHDFYKSASNYYILVMEYGGSSLFDFVLKVHEYIRNGCIDIYHWKTVVKIILKQMIECVDYMHSKNICHYDISLENFLINDVDIKLVKGKNKMEFILDDIRVKLCDFGLAQLFPSNQCRSNKTRGKSGYKSPELLSGRYFDAKKNDIWGLGVTLFKMTAGCAPWNSAKASDGSFQFAMNHSILPLLKTWGILWYFDDDLLHLLCAIFQNEENRICLNEIKNMWMDL